MRIHDEFDDFVEEVFKTRPEVKKEYDALTPLYNMIDAVIGARIEKGMSIEELAKLANVKKKKLVEFEFGNYNPSLKFLRKIAEPLDLKLEVKLIGQRGRLKIEN